MPEWYSSTRLPILLLQTLIAVQIFVRVQAGKRTKFEIIRYIVLAVCICQLGSYLVGPVPNGTPQRIILCVLVYLLSAGFLLYTQDLSIWSCLLFAASGYLSQDIAGNIKMILKLVPVIQQCASHEFGILVVDLICYGGVYLGLYFIFYSPVKSFSENFDDKLKAVFSVGTLIVCIGMARMTQDNLARNTTSVLAESVYGILCGILILMIQFGVMERTGLQEHMKMMHIMMEQQKSQYRLRCESVDLVNEKYHDLKSLIYGTHHPISKEQISGLDTAIQAYDIVVQTGNDILDVVLSEKHALCQRDHIPFTCLISGQDVDFLEELDLYSLLSNGLNNAIEATKACDPEQRYVVLKACRQGEVLFLHIENSYNHDLKMEKNRPVSPRRSSDHGFGIRSMEKTVAKYRGSLSIQNQDHIFSLDIVLEQSQKR